MELIQKIKEQIKDGKKVVIAIDGPSASGKSTLSSALIESFDALVFHVDDYFLPEHMKKPSRISEIGVFFHYERMISEIFATIHESHIISHHFNCSTQTLEKREPFPNKDVIIIEGVYSHHPILSSYIQFKVFMDVDEEEQERRILRRNGPKMLQRWQDEWIPLENQYFTHFDIKNQADFIISI